MTFEEHFSGLKLKSIDYKKQRLTELGFIIFDLDDEKINDLYARAMIEKHEDMPITNTPEMNAQYFGGLGKTAIADKEPTFEGLVETLYRMRTELTDAKKEIMKQNADHYYLMSDMAINRHQQIQSLLADFYLEITLLKEEANRPSIFKRVWRFLFNPYA